MVNATTVPSHYWKFLTNYFTISYFYDNICRKQQTLH